VRYNSIGCLASNSKVAKTAFSLLSKRYDLVDLKTSNKPVDLIIVLGGDGFMLHSLHQYMDLNVPFYGMNSGTVGFLMNSFSEENLLERIEKAQCSAIHPLRMNAHLSNNTVYKALAINEVYVLRQTNQAAKIKISIDNAVRMSEMTCDGVIVSTPAGSSAYNFSAGGPILPLEANLLALTPLSPFRPRRWGGALLPHNVSIRLDVIDHYKRPVSAVADFNEVRNIVYVEIKEERNKKIKILFDPGHSLEDRIIREQFAH
jgi:NAD+ kinase